MNETHSQVPPKGAPPETPQLPGFVLFDSPRLIFNRNSGGVCIYIREKLSNYCKLWQPTTPSSTGDVLWITYHPPKAPRPMYLCVIYSNPDGPKRPKNYPKFEEFWSEFETQVLEAASLGAVIIGGDLNAHITASGPSSDDRVEAPPYFYDHVLPDLSHVPERTIIDQSEQNKAGEHLLRLCRELSLLILNGRAPGDTGASATATRGQAVIDYWIISSSLFSEVQHLSVHSRRCNTTKRDLSDHHPVLLRLAAPNTASTAVQRKRADPPLYALAEKKRVQFGIAAASTLTEIQFDEHLDSCTNAGEVSACMDMFVQSVLAAAAATMPPQKPRRSWKARNLWYDDECRTARKQLACDLAATKLKLQRTRLRKAYDRLLSMKARAFYKAEAEKFAALLKTDPRSFCAKIRPRPPTRCPVSLSHLKEHFQRQNVAPQGPFPYRFDTWRQPAVGAAYNQTLPDEVKMELQGEQGPFDADDLLRALCALKNNRAPDAQGLRADILKFLLPEDPDTWPGHPMLDVLARLFNQVYRHGYPALYAAAHIIPLFKKGDRADAGNYRGISIISILAKLYATLLNQRLTAALEKAQVRAPTQAGFRPGKSCSDQIWTLQSLIELQCNLLHPLRSYTVRGKRGKYPSRRVIEEDLKKFGRGNLFCCFVDFSKAFDSVPRELLWARLRALEIPDDFIAAVQSYYESVQLRVKTEEGFSDPFESEVGVKQGCPLSPTLFGLFIDHFADFIQGHETSGDKLPRVLFYADDLVLIGYTESELRHLLGLLEDFCSKVGMTVNRQKTEVVIFRPSAKSAAPHLSQPFTFNGHPLAVVEEYKYLGFVFHAWKSPLNHGLPILINSANGAANFLCSRCRALHLYDLPTIFQLFDMYVRPILLYASEMWLPYLLTQVRGASDSSRYDYFSSEIEKVHTRFLRGLLHLPTSTPIGPLLWEVGRLPILPAAQQQLAQFVHKIALDTGTTRNRLYKLLDAQHDAADYANKAHLQRLWLPRARACLSSCEKAPLPTPRAETFVTAVVNRARQTAARAIRTSFFNAPPKNTLYHAYSHLVSSQPVLPDPAPVMAPYLQHSASVGNRLRVLRERLGLTADDNQRQRLLGIAAPQRSTCPYCPHPGVEDSTHRLLHCHRFTEVRASFPVLFDPPEPGLDLTRTQLLNTTHHDALGLYLYQCAMLSARKSATVTSKT
jgi:hypothetical protein